MYPFPGWRRVIFVAVLVVVIVVAFAPSVTEGTVRLHIFGVTPAGAISHLFVKFSSLQFHSYGFASGSGWVNTTETETVDLIDLSVQFLPRQAASVPIVSGRYDAIRMFMTNSTAVIGASRISLLNTPTLSANFTLPISPNGFGDILVQVTFDDSLILATPGTLSIQVIRTSVI